jgi:hypothetical protein
MGVCAATARTGKFQSVNAELAGLAALVAAGQKAVMSKSNQVAALSQVFPL